MAIDRTQMVELRWLVPNGMGGDVPKLQYRTHIAWVDSTGELCNGRSSWMDVPFVPVSESHRQGVAA